MFPDVHDAWRDAERLQGYLGWDREGAGPEGFEFQALVVTNEGKHLTDGRGDSFDQLAQALHVIRTLQEFAICVIVSDPETLRDLMSATTHPGSSVQIVRRLALAIYHRGFKVAIALRESDASAWELLDGSRHQLLKVTRRRESPPYVAVAVRRSRLWRLRSEPT